MVVTKFVAVIILSYIHVANHVVHTGLIQYYMSYLNKTGHNSSKNSVDKRKKNSVDQML